MARKPVRKQISRRVKPKRPTRAKARSGRLSHGQPAKRSPARAGRPSRPPVGARSTKAARHQARLRHARRGTHFGLPHHRRKQRFGLKHHRKNTRFHRRFRVTHRIRVRGRRRR